MHRCIFVLLSTRSFSLSKNVAVLFWRVIFLVNTPLHLNFCLSMKICSAGVLFDDVREGLLPFYDTLSHLINCLDSSSMVCIVYLGFVLRFWGFRFLFSTNGIAVFCLILIALDSLGSESYFSVWIYFMSHWNLVFMRVFLSWYLWLCLGINWAGSS